MKHFSKLFTILLIAELCGSIIAQTSDGPAPLNTKSKGSSLQFIVPQNTNNIGYGFSDIQNFIFSIPIPEGNPFNYLLTWYVYPNWASGMTKDRTGNYYITLWTSGLPELYRYDPTIGNLSLIGNITGMGDDHPNGIAYNPVNNVFYIISGTNLYSFDIGTLNAKLIDAFNPPINGIMIDLCFSPEGVCYAYESNVTPGEANGYIIDVTNAELTTLGYLGFTPNYGQGMSYDNETGSIYLSAYNYLTSSAQLRTMNPVTGATTLIVDWGIYQIDPFELDNEFEPYCPVGSPSNPYPATNTTNVPISTSQITWINGAGTTNVEVYFGKIGDLQMVYSGSPITNWTIAGQLEYKTTYEWKVKSLNDTCGVNGPKWLFTTEQNPSIVYNEFFCDAFENGTLLWNITDDGGTCVWKIMSHPFLNNYSLPPTAMGDLLAADAADCGSGTTTLTSATIAHSLDFSNKEYYNWNQITIEFDNDWYAINSNDEAHLELSTDGGTTWIGVWDYVGVSVRNSHEVVDITSLVNSQSNVTIRLRTIQPGYDGWWVVDNFCVKGEYITPVELTLFYINVNRNTVELNWTTATETNNQGFEIERKVYSNQLLGYQWDKIGHVTGFGTTTEPKSYSFIDNQVAQGKNTYRLKQVDYDGTFEYSDEVTVQVSVPSQFALEQNYPNPFNPKTIIKYSIPESGLVTINVYDALGQKVAELVNGQVEAGSYEVYFDASYLSSGIYFYRISVGSYTNIKKMILMR